MEIKRAKIGIIALLILVVVTFVAPEPWARLSETSANSTTETLSLRDLAEKTENYLGDRNATLTITNITVREDPEHRLKEKYFLVYVEDPYGCVMPFVIPEEDYSKYEPCLGKEAIFKLSGRKGPGLIHPPDTLITNILISKPADKYSREWYTIYITLIGLPSNSTNQLPSNTPLVFTVLAAVAASIALIAYRQTKRRVSSRDSLGPPAMSVIPALRSP